MYPVSETLLASVVLRYWPRGEDVPVAAWVRRVFPQRAV